MSTARFFSSKIRWLFVTVLLLAAVGFGIFSLVRAVAPHQSPSHSTIPAQPTTQVALSRTSCNLLPKEDPPDGATAEFKTDFSKHCVHYSEVLSGGPPKDGIPAIDAPKFVSVSQASAWLKPVEPVIFFRVGNEARAYPIQILTWHEIVNDTVGGVPVAVTFCPLCNTAIAYERTVNGRVLDFGTTGRLRFSNLLMYDRQTESWWQQALGQAVIGDLTGTQLVARPAAIISWAAFKSAYPNGHVLSETYRWTGDAKLLKEYRKVAEACLDWIDHYGDLDGDGFQEYKTFSSLGYENVNWKDSGDSVVYADGSQVKQPKGTCKLQGYVYDAKVRMAEVFQVLGDQSRAHALLQQAETLRRNFNAMYWMEDEGCYAYGQDADKRLITSIASNAGHCLWSGIADQDKAERTARRLLQDDMWSGWGIRTLSSKNPAYNPYSYHLGSVWPHDNGIIAAGFKRYGLANEANQVIRAIFDAGRRFEAYRLPEIFAGVRRKGEKTDFPALYPPGANVPQAWASGSVFQMMQTILGLRADAPHKGLYVNPTLPEWLSDWQLQHLRVGPCSFTLHFWRERDRSRWEVINMTADHGVAQEEIVQVMDEPQRAS